MLNVHLSCDKMDKAYDIQRINLWVVSMSRHLLTRIGITQCNHMNHMIWFIHRLKTLRAKEKKCCTCLIQVWWKSIQSFLVNFTSITFQFTESNQITSWCNVLVNTFDFTKNTNKINAICFFLQRYCFHLLIIINECKHWIFTFLLSDNFYF